MAAILILLWILFLISIVVSIVLLHSSTTYEFQDFGNIDIPYITIDIQGNPMNMVVDTGCGVSLLNLQAIKDCELLYRECPRTVSLSAITDDTVHSSGITIDFTVGKKEVSEDFFLRNDEDFGGFMRMYGVQLHGLLGSSFFEKNNCEIDFKNHTLTVL